MRELAEKEGYDLDASYAYSDSATDAPMLEVVGHPFAVNPDKALREIALERELAGARLRDAGGAAAPDCRTSVTCRRSRPSPPWPSWARRPLGLLWYVRRRSRAAG